MLFKKSIKKSLKVQKKKQEGLKMKDDVEGEKGERFET